MNGSPRRVALAALILLAVAATGLPSGSRGETVVSGEVSGLWTAAGNPYLVTDGAVVPAAAALDIGPGVEVRFAPDTGLLVLGTLIVRGSDGAPVSFTSNTSTSPGSWGGIVVEGTASIASAHISFAGTALEIRGAATVDRLVATKSSTGLYVNGTSATLARSFFTLNEAAGGRVRGGSANYLASEFSSNGWNLVLESATASLDNGSLATPTLGDAELTASTLTLRNSTSSGAFQFHDGESTVVEKWFSHVLVGDLHGTPVPGATVTVEGDGLPVPLVRSTDPTGVARWIELVGRTSSFPGPQVPAYTFTGMSRGETASTTTTLGGDTRLAIALPADVTDPVADGGPDLAGDEDATIAFDASASSDNDPAFPAGATFRWRIDEYGVVTVVTGSPATHVFATPGEFSVVLEVTDAAGNSGADLLLVSVRDTTPPSAALSVTPQAYLDESVVLDGSGSVDNDPRFAESANFTWTLESGGRTETRYGRVVAFSAWWAAGEYSVTLRVRDSGGNEDVAFGSVRILARPSLDLGWVAVGLAAWFTALGIAGTERGKMGFITWFLLPLYTRMKKDEVLDQFTRGQIFGYIVVHPGDSFTDIKRNLQLNNGTLTYHLNVLERDGMVTGKNVGTRKLFYAKGARVPEDGGGMHEVQQQIMKHLQESGGLAVNDVAGVLGISRQLAIYHLRDLSRRGLVRIERKAFRIVAYADDRELPPPPPP